jgi:hypothetical protein
MYFCDQQGGLAVSNAAAWNPVGLLITSIPFQFQGVVFQQWRDARHQRVAEFDAWLHTWMREHPAEESVAIRDIPPQFQGIAARKLEVGVSVDSRTEDNVAQVYEAGTEKHCGAFRWQ